MVSHWREFEYKEAITRIVRVSRAVRIVAISVENRHFSGFSWKCLKRESNQFIVKFFSKTLIWRNFCEKTVAEKFRNFHSVKITEIYSHTFLAKFSWKCRFYGILLNGWFVEIFFAVRKFFLFPRCVSVSTAQWGKTKNSLPCHANIFPSNQVL